MNPTELADPALRSELRAQAYSVLRRHPGFEDHVDDAVQECLMRGHAKLETYDPKRATFAGWMHGIMVHVLMESGRKLNRRPAQSENPGSWAAVEAIMEPEADRNRVNGLLAKLTPDQREIVTLHHLEDWPHERIAAKLGIGPNAARTRLCRAMIELKRLAAQEGDR